MSAASPSEPDLFQGALFVGESRLRSRDYAHAVRAFARAARIADTDEDHELARALVHLAAAGYRARRADVRGRERQLAHARRRLAPFLPATRRLDLTAMLVAVERAERG